MRRYNVCDGCGHLAYRVVYNGQVTWVTHGNLGVGAAGRVTCPTPAPPRAKKRRKK